MRTRTMKFDDYDYLTQLSVKTFASGWAFKAIGGIIMAVYGFFIPIHGFLILTFCLVTADMITGIIATRYPQNPDERIEISSRRMARTIYKGTLYAISIMAFHGVAHTFELGVEMAYFAAFFIAVTELQSIDENINRVLGISIFGEIKKRLGHLFKK